MANAVKNHKRDNAAKSANGKIAKPAGRGNVKTLKPTGPKIDTNGKMVKPVTNGKALKRTSPKTIRIPK